MNITIIDWIIILLFFAITLGIGVWASKSSGKSAKEFFLSGRNMPWWLLGVSMVATTFSADTPNLVTDIVRQNGVAGNWAWWAFLLTGMTTVFIYAKLWRRSGITTDLEFYELRYSGKEAQFLRGFRAIYLGVVFNVLIMATVMLAGIKIAGIMLDISPIQTVLLVSLVTVVYSSLGGLKGVIMTDFFQFTLSMIGMIAAAIFILNLPEIGGMQNLIAHPNVASKIDFVPDLSNPEVAIPLFFIPLAVQWWSVWYPGAEPGGGGYVAQRMLSAKKEEDALKATLFFNVAHYALRPWPWIIIAFASLVFFPELQDIQKSFPNLDSNIIGHDLAFPAMLNELPVGLKGLVIASLIAALMSTISTHLNWGSSYLVNDFYVRFFDEEADDQTQVKMGRIFTVTLMLLAAIFSLYLSNALEAFNILLQIGAGTGLLFILRWFWWRINAYSEITAMVVSFFIAIYFEKIYNGELLDYQKMCIGVVITTVAWLAATFMTRRTDERTLIEFYELIKPHSIGWKDISSKAKPTKMAAKSLAEEIFMVFLACIIVYMALFGAGYLLYGNMILASITLGISIILSILLFKIWK